MKFLKTNDLMKTNDLVITVGCKSAMTKYPNFVACHNDSDCLSDEEVCYNIPR